jgi:5-methylcytosine-specific restriction endonuclease McrA
MLNRQVLVLNRHWVAVHVCTVRRALTLLFQELARVVTADFETYDFQSWRELSAFADGTHPIIHTPNFQMLLPRVIVLSRYQSWPPRLIKFNRGNIFIRDHHTCQYCGRTPREDDLTIDHMIPKSRGGHTVWENVVLACTTCNTKKGNRLPSECGMQPIRAPKKPSWLSTIYSIHLDEDNRSLWQKFVDTAYWETRLHE